MQALLSPFVFVVLRALSGIIPPIPGFIFDSLGIIIFGSVVGFVLGEIGVMIGACASFFIARKFRDSFLIKKRFLKRVHDWEQKIPKNTEFWGLVLMRLLTNGVFDYLNYALGLTKTSFSRFFFSTLLGTLPIMAFFYFAGGWVLGKGTYYFIALIAMTIIIWFVFRSRKN